MQPWYLLVGILSLYKIQVLAIDVSTRHRCWNKDPANLNKCLDTPQYSPTPVIYKFKRRDEEGKPSVGESYEPEVITSTSTPVLTEVTPTSDVSSTHTAQPTHSVNSDRALFTPTFPNQVENTTPTENNKNQHSADESKKLMGLPLAAGIGIIVGIVLLACIIGGFFTYLHIKRRRARRWPKSTGYIDLHDVPTTSRRAHPPPLLSSGDEAHANLLHPSMHPAVISARARDNSPPSPGISRDHTQPEMSEGIIATTQTPRSDYPKPTIYRLSVAPMLASQQDLDFASGSNSSNEPESSPDYSFVMSAILSYKPRQEGEIEVNVGDELAITDEMGPDWLIGFNLTTNSVTGGFPRTCVTGTSYQ
ncbi:hypothetical protein K7432_000140 [Basidiobolus ranarum]|uniref:SH3 domain-containing protein n=1 Tax=Basidiobolus ranarum TaxID=34480 RepID=A0ABR2WBL8_9FUNG